MIVISDIGNEPDDQMSLVRLLLYSNELDIEGLIASTSTWQKTAIHPETMRMLVEAYGQVRPNLLLNAKGWPEAAELDEPRLCTGRRHTGWRQPGAGKASRWSRGRLCARVERDDARPLWICLWGGANTLAQALMDLRAGARRRPRSTRLVGAAAGVLDLRPGRRGAVDAAGVSGAVLGGHAVDADQRRVRLRHVDGHQRRRLLPQRRRARTSRP